MRHSWNDKHIDKSVKSLLKSLYATLGIFLFLFVAFHISSAFYTSYIANTQLNKFRIGISEDTHYLMNQGDAVSKNNILINDLVNKNREDLVKTLNRKCSRDQLV